MITPTLLISYTIRIYTYTQLYTLNLTKNKNNITFVPETIYVHMIVAIISKGDLSVSLVLGL